MSTTTGPSQTYIDNQILYMQTTYIGIIQTDADDAIIVFRNFELNFLGEPAPNVIMDRVDFANY